MASMVRMFPAKVVSPKPPWLAISATTPRAVSSCRKVMNSWISVVMIER